MPLDLTDDKSTLVQVMVWCRQATNHYLSQCWPRFMSPYGVTRPQWVNGRNSPVTGALMFSLICLKNGWVNNWHVGDLRRHRAYYDVTVMFTLTTGNTSQRRSRLIPCGLIPHWLLYSHPARTVEQSMTLAFGEPSFGGPRVCVAKKNLCPSQLAPEQNSRLFAKEILKSVFLQFLRRKLYF